MRALPLIALVCCLVAGPVVASARQAQENTIYKPGNGVTGPVVVKEIKPQYTADAMRAKVEGTVTLEGVVQPDGVMGEVRVTKALDPGLDQEAIKAVKQWRFKPGLKGGEPVAVRVTLEMSFTLRNKPSQPLFPVPPPAPIDARATAPNVAPEVYKPGNGVTAPVVVKQVKPQYTADAMRAKVEGVVTLECVVQPDGLVGEVRVTKALDPGLDQEAITTVRRWRFEPGKKDGKAVPVRITLDMTFSLR